MAFALGIAIRCHNALHFPLMRGYDAFAHFGYIWFLAEEGRVPPATAGWEFFQPPAYYAFMLVFWKGLAGIDALLRLRLGTMVLAVATVLPAWLALKICRRSLPSSPGIALAAAGLLLFLPVQIYSAGFLGNESLCAVLSGIALAVLLWTLRDPRPTRCVLLGLALGLAMLSKFTAIVVVAASLGALVLRAMTAGDLRAGLARAAMVTASLLVVCGWFYGRNAIEYGNPFQLSREGLFLSQIEDSQLQGRRGVLEYVLFDPVILYRPQWPRGLSLDSPRPADVPYSAMRESIPTGLYANAWFDGYGGFILPRITESETSRRAGQLLLSLGMIPTLLIAAGVVSGLRRLRRKGWDDTIVVMLLASMAMAAVIVVGTRSVPTQAAVKATYLLPVSIAFAFWFALGLEALHARFPAFGRVALGLCVLLAVVSSSVFTEGLLFEAKENQPASAAVRNLHGVVYAAAGRREQARDLFRSAARDGWALAEENLAAFALDDDQPLEALYRTRVASRRQSSQLARTNRSQSLYRDATLAEYANTEAVIFQRLGWTNDAIAAAHRARRLDPGLPEAHYNLGVLLLDRAIASPSTGASSRITRRARRAFAKAVALDPAYREAEAMAGVAATLEGRCELGAAMIRNSAVARPCEHRLYPMRTGPGDQNAAALHRRRQIEPLPAALDPATRLRECGGRNA
ncbi:MAG: glycosyltransferase family 39 protein [Candidatus Binatia bacterium]